MIETCHEINNVESGLTNNIEQNQTDVLDKEQPLQQIYYGSPGTGKSHLIKMLTEKAEQEGRVVRTTFHPDSDYSTFVGAYKPTSETEDRYDNTGHLVKYQEGEHIGMPIQDKKIIYDFIEQAFLKTYIDAWHLYIDALENEEIPEKEYLIIEEINRGNCAQIFGDLFQLLDRNEEGFSDYEIVPDSDISIYLNKRLSFSYSGNNTKIKQVLSGNLMMLPPNLYIWATMNTSDQSLFPIDSAFKRRWDWRFVPITKGEGGWRIYFKYKIGNEEKTLDVDWWNFLLSINSDILEATKSEDKQLGYYFCKATKYIDFDKEAGTVSPQGDNVDNTLEKGKDSDKNLSPKPNVITADTFVDKVIFYLWQDVFKTSSYRNTLFKIGDKQASFHQFYEDIKCFDEKGNRPEINLEIVDSFINKIMKRHSDKQQ